MAEALQIAALLALPLGLALALLWRRPAAGVVAGALGLGAFGLVVATLGGVPGSPAPEEPTPEAPLLTALRAAPERSFDAATLHTEINGAADVFIRHGLTRASFRTLRVRGVDVTVERYELGSAEDARAVFGEHVAPDRPRTPSLGDEGAVDDQGGDVRSGRIYVRVTHNGGEPVGLAEHLAALARAALHPPGDTHE
ncbi:MAG: hypothetical protein AMXMBFR64_21590 [Myxococcales bacterium]